MLIKSAGYKCTEMLIKLTLKIILIYFSMLQAALDVNKINMIRKVPLKQESGRAKTGMNGGVSGDGGRLGGDFCLIIDNRSLT